MAILMGILAVVIIAVFATAFFRDKKRSNKISDDEERIGTEQPRHNPPTGT
jgi:septation ring formation regulator EzrA